MQIIFRSWNLLLTFVGSALSYFERSNPAALLEREKEKLRSLIGNFNQGLISHAALSERLMTQVSRAEAQQTEIAGKVRALLNAKQDAAAARYALQLKQISTRLDEDRKQLASAEETYENLVRTRDAAVAEAKANIEHVRRQIGDLKVKRAIADLESMATAMVSDLGTAGDSFNRLRDMVEEEREKASARARVATGSLAETDLVVNDVEQDALASQALKEFLADQGIARTDAQPALPDLSTESEPAALPRSGTGSNTL